MVKLAQELYRLRPVRIMVIGDMLLDSYTIGKAKRISPEAPVAIVNVLSEEKRPGGAGNVILNLLSLGAQVVAVGRVGNDEAGNTFIHALQNESVDTSSILLQEHYRTPVKNRIIADNQQIVRIDHEQMKPLSVALESILIENIPSLLADIQIIALSDYGKGFLSKSLLAAIFLYAGERGIPVVTDPKGQDFEKYKGTTIIKPNLSEAYAAAQLSSHADLEQVASIVLKQTEAQMLIVTRSELGISVFDRSGIRQDFAAHLREVKDVTGAGDTVLAVLVYALANHLSIEDTAQLCNVAAGLAIEQVGCARISLSDLSSYFLAHKMGQKIFDEIDLFMLKEMVKKKEYQILSLPVIDRFTHSLFVSIQSMAKENTPVLVYMEGGDSSDELVNMLTSLSEVSFIVRKKAVLQEVCYCMPPQCGYVYDAEEEQLYRMDWKSRLFEQESVRQESSVIPG